MKFLEFTMFLLLFVIFVTHHLGNAKLVNFNENFNVSYGQDHFTTLNRGRVVQLSLDNTSGSFPFYYFHKYAPKYASTFIG
ncbi:putative xyloglucan:xyloglucosyl transferase [Lupinus albus]|uniref:Putative xyloglucan:xyloglucosyl transferase n=1 Tax=Lupinus albus TaxID=3870 RepID=A0A6A4QD40_LUPAL|nr:putative xyloglucan:xyloglucosyl transferase [Lupinus albus]